MTRQVYKLTVSFLLLATAVGLWLWPALYNGFPLVLTDTETYVRDAFTFDFNPLRAVGYPLVLRALGIGYSSWWPVVAQTVITILLVARAVHLTCRTSMPTVLLGIIITGLLTTGPKYTSWLIADCTLIWGVSSCIILLFSQMTIERFIAGAMLAISVVCHRATGPILLITLGWMAMVMVRFQFAREKLKALSMAGVIILLASLILPRSLIALLASKRPEGSTATVLLSKLAEHDLILPILKKYCPSKHWRHCDGMKEFRYFAGTPAWYLWDGESLRYTEIDTSIWDTPEKVEIVTLALKEQLWKFLPLAIGESVQQFFVIDSQEGIDRDWDAEVVFSAYDEHLPNQAQALVNSRQRRSDAKVSLLPIDERWLYFPCLALTLLFGILNRRRDQNAAYVALFIGVLLVSNAFVAGFFTGVYGRYQGRISWLTVLFVTVFVAKNMQEFVSNYWNMTSRAMNFCLIVGI